MKQKKSVKLVLLAVIVIITNFSCSKKDAIQTNNFELKTMVNSIKNWYDSSKRSARQHDESSKIIITYSNQREVEKLLFDDISWDKAMLHFDSSNRKGIKIPVLKNEITGERIELASLYHNGKVKGYFVQLKPTKEWYLKNKHKGNYQYVDGEMNIFSVKGKFLEKIILEKGMLKRMGSEINNQTQSIVTHTDEQVIEAGRDLDGVTVVGHPHHSAPGYYSFYFLDIINPNSGSSDEDSVPYDNAGGGSGGDGGDSNEEDTIYNNIDSLVFPCAHKVINNTIDCNDAIKQILKNVFGLNSEVNLTFRMNNSLPDTTVAIAKRLRGSLVDYMALIELNPKFVCGSEDYIASTVIHESIHTYIDYMRVTLDSNQFKQLFPIYWKFKGVNPNETQHQEMANNYVNFMTDLLINLNPNIRPNVANALAWGGLERTELWKKKADFEKNNIIKINLLANNPTQGAIDTLGIKKCN